MGDASDEEEMCSTVTTGQSRAAVVDDGVPATVLRAVGAMGGAPRPAENSSMDQRKRPISLREAEAVASVSLYGAS
jgi:hypothetical protein